MPGAQAARSSTVWSPYRRAVASGTPKPAPTCVDVSFVRRCARAGKSLSEAARLPPPRVEVTPSGGDQPRDVFHGFVRDVERGRMRNRQSPSGCRCRVTSTPRRRGAPPCHHDPGDQVVSPWWHRMKEGHRPACCSASWITRSAYSMTGRVCSAERLPSFLKAVAWLMNAPSWLFPAATLPRPNCALAASSFAFSDCAFPALTGSSSTSPASTATPSDGVRCARVTRTASAASEPVAPGDRDTTTLAQPALPKWWMPNGFHCAPSTR